MWIARVAASAAVLAMASGYAVADTPDRDALQAVLTDFVRAFNTGDADHVCDIFARDLIYDYRGLPPDRTFKDICDGLRATLADRTRHYGYALNRREIQVFGDIASVRVVWDMTLTVAGAKPVHAQEYSLDLFRREPGGGWKLFRFNAYEAE